MANRTNAFNAAYSSQTAGKALYTPQHQTLSFLIAGPLLCLCCVWLCERLLAGWRYLPVEEDESHAWYTVAASEERGASRIGGKKRDIRCYGSATVDGHLAGGLSSVEVTAAPRWT